MASHQLFSTLQAVVLAGSLVGFTAFMTSFSANQLDQWIAGNESRLNMSNEGIVREGGKPIKVEECSGWRVE